MAYTFLRWLRTGMAAAVGDTPQAVAAGRRASLTVGVEVAGTGVGSQVPTVDLEVLGPGDVSGIDPGQVIRSFPRPGTLDFAPEYHAHVDLDRPDLPWLFTPFGPTPGGLLRPWICLVVAEVGEHARLEPGLPLPRLRLTGPELAELPVPADVHRWAHVQVTGSTAAGMQAIAEGEPEKILSRLVSPRALRPDTAYVACVVPTFRIGALGGLGRPVPATMPLDAWAPADTLVELPVYHHWEFTTGRDGDFRSLVLRLEARAVPAGVGTRALQVATPGFGLPDRTAPAAVPLGGALRVVDPAPTPVDPALAASLAGLLNVERAVGPPIYGRWHAGVTQVRMGGAPVGWVDELNLDARYRVAAGLGTRIVQERQEDLMAAVWEQLGELLRANAQLRAAQLAVAASERVVARHLTPLPDAALLLAAGPAAARIRLGQRRTVRGAVASSCLPLLALSGAFRRVLRPRGPLQRRLAPRAVDVPPSVLQPPAVDVAATVEALAAGALTAPPVRLPSGAVAIPQLPDVAGPGRRPDRRGGDPGPLADLAGVFALLAGRAAAPGCTPLDVAAVAGGVRAAIVPDVAVAGRVRARIAVPASPRVRLSARLDPIMAAPEIPTPMFGPLLELGADWLLPGLGDLPPNTVAMVEPDAAFIEAYMVGLNHELARELLWRGFPTDQRGTVFSRFWDRRAAVSTTVAPAPGRDIPDIHTWGAQRPLGASLASGGGPGLVVLLLRGDLLQRFPQPTIYLQRGQWVRDARGVIERQGGVSLRAPVALTSDADWDAHVRFPQFGGQTGADVAFLGFPLPRATVHGIAARTAPGNATDDEAGWYVVFEEQPTEPRFGRVPPPTGQPATVSDELAAQLLRRAFRLSVHASDLIDA